MAGYIGSKASVTQVDGYNRTEASNEFVQVTGDTMTGALTSTDLYLSGGVYLGGTGSANKLDDYEKGTWTPVLDFQTSSSGGLNYIQQQGRYIKIGNLVFVSAYLSWDQNNFTASSGFLQLGGLPFNNEAQNLYRGGLSITFSTTPWTGLTVYQSSFRAEVGATNFTFNYADSTNGSMGLPIIAHGNIDSDGGFMVTGTYSTI